MLKNTNILDHNKLNHDFINYIENSLNFKQINWYNLPNNLILHVPGLKLNRDNIKVSRLKRIFGNDPKVNRFVRAIYKHGQPGYNVYSYFPIALPFKLDNLFYVQLYSLMASEGSHSNEFRLHVPEIFFHCIFRENLSHLFGTFINDQINTLISNGVQLQYAPEFIRHLVPIPNYIPKLILENKEFARNYLRIAFEAEGHPHLKNSKRYIKLTRNIGIDELVKEKLSYKTGTRIFLRELQKDYPILYKEIFKKPPPLLLGESLLLFHYFGIENQIKPEALLINKTNFRRGFYSVRWNLHIYAESIVKFIKEINFISQSKKDICKNMLLLKSNKPAYYALRIMCDVSNNNIFRAKDFNNKMKGLGYVSPVKFIWDYNKKGLITRIKKGHYLLTNSADSIM